MNKKTIRQWIDDSYDKGLISDEKYEKYYRELNNTQNPTEFWKSIRGELSGLGGFVEVDKSYKSDADLADMIEKEIPNLDYENLSLANKRDIAKNLNISIEDVERGIEELWNRDMDKGIEFGTKEANENRQIVDEYKRAQDIKDSKLASNFGNQYAIKRYIEGAPKWEVRLNEGLGVVGKAADFVPTKTKVGSVPVGFIAGATSPVIRFGQKAVYTPSEEYDLVDELLNTGRDIIFNEATGLVGDKQSRKLIGDVGADMLGTKGKVGKALGDVIETAFEKYPRATPAVGTGLMRYVLNPYTKVSVGDKAIKDAEKNYENAKKEAYKQYKPYWDKGLYLPDDNSSDIVKEAYKEYMENK